MTSQVQAEYGRLLMRVHVGASVPTFHIFARTGWAQEEFACTWEVVKYTARSVLHGTVWCFWCVIMFLPVSVQRMCVGSCAKVPKPHTKLVLHPYFINPRVCNCITNWLRLLKSLWRLFTCTTKTIWLKDVRSREFRAEGGDLMRFLTH